MDFNLQGLEQEKPGERRLATTAFKLGSAAVVPFSRPTATLQARIILKFEADPLTLSQCAKLRVARPRPPAYKLHEFTRTIQADPERYFNWGQSQVLVKVVGRQTSSQLTFGSEYEKWVWGFMKLRAGLKPEVRVEVEKEEISRGRELFGLRSQFFQLQSLCLFQNSRLSLHQKYTGLLQLVRADNCSSMTLDYLFQLLLKQRLPKLTFYRLAAQAVQKILAQLQKGAAQTGRVVAMRRNVIQFVFKLLAEIKKEEETCRLGIGIGLVLALSNLRKLACASGQQLLMQSVLLYAQQLQDCRLLPLPYSKKGFPPACYITDLEIQGFMLKASDYESCKVLFDQFLLLLGLPPVFQAQLVGLSRLEEDAVRLARLFIADCETRFTPEDRAALTRYKASLVVRLPGENDSVQTVARTLLKNAVRGLTITSKDVRRVLQGRQDNLGVDSPGEAFCQCLLNAARSQQARSNIRQRAATEGEWLEAAYCLKSGALIDVEALEPDQLRKTRLTLQAVALHFRLQQGSAGVAVLKTRQYLERRLGLVGPGLRRTAGL